MIQKYDSNTKAIKYFAGVDGQRHFIDGSVPLLYEPIKLYYSEGNLYVLDFNVIRKITIENGIATIMETIAGEVSTETNPSTLPGKADSVVFAHSNQSDFIVEENTILFTDPKKSVVWQIDFNND